MLHGYSDRIHHALAFTAKHHPGPVSRYDGHSCLIRASSVAVILARHGSDEATITASILKQLVDSCELDQLKRLHADIKRKFGETVAETVESASEPRYDPLGRERTWKAARFEYLARLQVASARAVDVVAADELHRLGAALVSVRRLGVEYLEAAGVPQPDDTRWWLGSLLEMLRRHVLWRRTDILAELARTADDLNGRLRESGY
ncbi:MAG: HD domain-containing protein [Gemmatimonadales bacterium]